MTRIVYVTDAFAVCGGIERVLADKMNCLVENDGYKVTLVTVNQGDHPLSFNLHHNVCHIDLHVRMHQQYQFRGVKRLLIRRKLKKLFCSRLKEFVANVKPDIIICVKFDFIGVLLKIKGSARLIVESHTLCRAEQIDGSGFIRRMHISYFKKNITKADAVIALTEGDAKDWRKINSHVYVIPNIVQLNKDNNSLCDNKSVIYVGRICAQKDIDSLLSIWQIVHYCHHDWVLKMYGAGELEEEFRSKIQSIDANIQVENPASDIISEYKQNSMLLLTSFYEPFGLVLPEAMSFGLPVVAFDCPYGPADIITDGVDGFLIKNRDIDEFANKVCLLIESEELRRQMGNNGIISSQRYRADVIMPQWISLFEELTSGQ